MSLDTTYQLIDRQRFPTGELVENVYFFDGAVGTPSAEDLLDGFLADVIPSIIAIQSNQLVHYELIGQSLGLPADFATLSLVGQDGNFADDSLSAFTAINFTLRPATRLIRPGSKRYSGIPDYSALYVNGVVTDATLLGYMEDLRDTLKTAVTGALGTYTPILVKRIFVPADPPDHGAYYRLPISDGELVVSDVVNVLVNNRLTHQTSRGNSR